jgi:hypothetical protein
MTSGNKTVSFRIDEETVDELRSNDDDPSCRCRRCSATPWTRSSRRTARSKSSRARAPGRRPTTPRPKTPEIRPRSRVPRASWATTNRVELECDHLREQLSEYKQYVTRLEAQLDEGRQAEAELIRLGAVDAETGTSLLVE